MIIKEIKRRWITALRSDEFKQGMSRLYRNGQHCALGVLLETDDRVSRIQRSDGVSVFNFEQDSGVCIIPLNFRKDIGMTDEELGTIMRMNDNQKKTFSEIADWIEDNL